ncbi:hypothetical protein AMTR_s00033p00145790 [Amborella trichopoda]|uniref:Uncharacterized protein n=1 Tax=Amborella trichopoda TaxID=13333 RepID=U5CVU7_AMBTC|nr:hypothetical protein AMTR_s00033p00145790 [Amborella trichopoda]
MPPATVHPLLVSRITVASLQVFWPRFSIIPFSELEYYQSSIRSKQHTSKIFSLLPPNGSLGAAVWPEMVVAGKPVRCLQMDGKTIAEVSV